MLPESPSVSIPQSNNENDEKDGKFIVGLDIGTTKICVVIGKMSKNSMEIIGVGTSPASGIHNGVITNIENAVGAISRAVAEAELISGHKIESVVVGITGEHIKGVNTNGVVAIKNINVSEGDVCRAFNDAKQNNIPMNVDVLHILSQEFIIDEQNGISKPIDMSGVRLEAKVHIVICAAVSIQNIIKTCNRASLQVTDIVTQHVTSSHAVLSNDEKTLGVCMVDIGGGTTNIAIFVNGQIRYTSVLGIGGNQITNDIAVALRTPIAEAEKIKQKYGCCFASLVGNDDVIMVQSVDSCNQQAHYCSELCNSIMPRTKEILMHVNNEIEKSGLGNSIASGVVITGGSSLLEGLRELAKQILNRPVRLGLPNDTEGLIEVVNSPTYAAGVGLVKYFYENPDAWLPKT